MTPSQPPVKRPRGRPPAQPDKAHTRRVEIRLTPAQHDKLEQLGGAAWVRTRIDKAKTP